MFEGDKGAYRYRYSSDAGTEEVPSPSEVETLKAIQESIQLLMGGCEICQFSTGAFCTKHRRSFSPGDPRCELFARRFPQNPQKASKAQSQDFVREILGIRDQRTLERLAGYP